MKHFKILVTFIILLFSLSLCDANNISKNGNSGFVKVKGKKMPLKDIRKQSEIFFKDKINTINITINSNLFHKYVMGNKTVGDIDYSKIDEFDFNGYKIKNVGMRSRGSFFSRGCAKRQFKLHFGCDKMIVDSEGKIKDFKEIDDRRFFGLNHLNLRCNPNNDYTLIIDKLVSEVFLAGGAPYSRVGLGKVYINKKYWGLYLLTEHPDATFLKLHFKTSKGNFYKCKSRSNFYAGNSRKFQVSRSYEKEPRKRLEGFFEKLSKADTLEKFSKIIDVKTFIAYWACSVLTGHWDSIIGTTQNNDRIFYNAKNKKWYVVGWDGDNSYGLGFRYRWMGKEIGPEASVDNFGHSKDRSNLFKKAHEIDELFDKYKAKLKYLMKNIFNEEKLNARIEKLRKMIKPHLDKEPDNSKLKKEHFDREIDNLKEYVKERYDFVEEALN